MKGIYKTIKDKLPEFKTQIETIIEKMFKEING